MTPATRRWTVIGPLVAIGLFVLIWTADSRGGEVAPPAVNAPAKVDVLYEVEGTTSSASVTMQTPTGTSQITPAVPMRRESDGRRGLEAEFSPGSFVYISAQNKQSSGTITCRITVNGSVIAENTSSGGYAIASCSGRAR
jgi:hypothetical protein